MLNRRQYSKTKREIHKLEDSSTENTRAETQGDKKAGTKYERYAGHRRSTICVTGILEGEKRKLGQKQYLKRCNL